MVGLFIILLVFAHQLLVIYWITCNKVRVQTSLTNCRKKTNLTQLYLRKKEPKNHRMSLLCTKSRNLEGKVVKGLRNMKIFQFSKACSYQLSFSHPKWLFFSWLFTVKKTPCQTQKIFVPISFCAIISCHFLILTKFDPLLKNKKNRQPERS